MPTFLRDLSLGSQPSSPSRRERRLPSGSERGPQLRYSAVRLRHKLRKLITREPYESVLEHALRALHPVRAQPFLEGLDPREWHTLREEYPHRPGARRINRYDDFDYWIRINIERAQDIWLDRSPPLRILDLGSGAGYFLHVCNRLGHHATGLDIDDEPLFRGTTKLLGVERVLHRIEPTTPLPSLGKFDLITAHRICFNRLGRNEAGDWNEWSVQEWSYFLDDVRANLLNSSGRIVLDFLTRPDGHSFFTTELREFFTSQGGRIFRSRVLLDVNPSVAPQLRN